VVAVESRTSPSPRLCNINRHLHSSLASESCRHASGPAIAIGEDVLTSASSTRRSPTAGLSSWIARWERSPTALAPCSPGGSGALSASLPPLGAASSRTRCAFPPTHAAVLQPSYTVLRLLYYLAPVCTRDEVAFMLMVWRTIGYSFNFEVRIRKCRSRRGSAVGANDPAACWRLWISDPSCPCSFTQQVAARWPLMWPSPQCRLG